MNFLRARDKFNRSEKHLLEMFISHLTLNLRTYVHVHKMFCMIRCFLNGKMIAAQQTFTCSKSTLDTLEKGVTYVQN